MIANELLTKMKGIDYSVINEYLAKLKEQKIK